MSDATPEATSEAARDGVTRLAFVVDGLGASQASYSLIKNLNAWLAGSVLRDGCVFARRVEAPCLACEFPVFSASDLANYRGACVATSFDAALELAGLQGPGIQGPRVLAYYAQDPEWTCQYRPFDEWRRVLLSPHFKILCRSTYHQELFRRCWNVRPAVADDFDIGEILTWLSG